MNQRVFGTIKKQLLTERCSLIATARRTLTEEAEPDSGKLSDELDKASAEYDNAMEFHLRDREKYYLAKIDRALEKFDKNRYGLCEGCRDPIGVKRLLARPVTTLCILCKEEQEIDERSYG